VKGNASPALVLSRSWKADQGELPFVVRTVAGAASRRGPVTVLTPDDAPGPVADGAFDLFGVGSGDVWTARDVHLPSPLGEGSIIIVDEITDDLTPWLRSTSPQAVFAIADASGGAVPRTILSIVGGGDDGEAPFIGLHVPVNPLAAAHRHNGFGFVGYLLVLSDRTGPQAQPPDAAAWLTAAFHDANVVVVEDAVASVWRGRALRGSTTVDSRTDLWRLIAHARVCIDLAPGPFVARECIESLRFGTPIIVPEGTAAARHAAAGGGLTFASMGQLVHRVEQCDDEAFLLRLADEGKRYADDTYGDPLLFCRRVAQALSGAVAQPAG
jgi:hypothetical protein